MSTLKLQVFAAAVLSVSGFNLSAQDKAPSPAPIKNTYGWVPGELLKQVPPAYPQLAKMAGIQGTVKFRARIGKDGTVQDLVLIDGPEPLVKAAMDAVKQWIYKPYLLNGSPAEIVKEIGVNFVLQ